MPRPGPAGARRRDGPRRASPASAASRSRRARSSAARASQAASADPSPVVGRRRRRRVDRGGVVGRADAATAARGAVELGSQALGLGLVPGRLADDRLEPRARERVPPPRPRGVAGGPALVGARGLDRAGAACAVRPRPTAAARRSATSAVERARASRPGARSRRAVRGPIRPAPSVTPSVVDDRGPVARHGDPARRQDRLDGEACRAGRAARRPGPGAPGTPPVASRRTRRVQRAAAGRGEGLAEPALAAIVAAPDARRRPLRDDERAALAGERGDRSPRDDVGAGSHRPGPPRPPPAGRVDREVLVEPAAADAPCGAGDPARLLLGQPWPRGHRAAPGPAVADALAVTARSWAATRSASAASAALARGLAGGRQPPARPRSPSTRLARAAASSRLERGSRLGRRARLRRPRRSARRSTSASRRRAVSASAWRAAAARRRAASSSPCAWRARAQRRRARRGRRPARVPPRRGRLEVEIARRDRRGQRASAGGDLGLGRGPFVEQARAVAFQRLELRGEPRVAQLRRVDGGPRRIMGLAPLALERRRARRARAASAAAAASAARAWPSPGRPRPSRASPRSAWPTASRAAASCQRACIATQQRARELVGGGLAGRLLLGLGGQPPGLRPELAEDVLGPGQVRLGLDELLLGTTSPALVAADPGHLLEQRPPLLGAQRQGLVDHALPDEQERVVGEVRGVEQVDQVAQPDPALVEEVVVLARAVQPAAELEHLEVDRQQPVGVVEDERDVRHALGGALVRAGPDDVLGLRERSARPCSPSAQRRASARLLLPDPFGPTTALMPGPNSTFVRSAKDLKPWSRSASRRGSAGDRSGSVTRRSRRAPTRRRSRRAPTRPRSGAAARAPLPRRPSRRSGARGPRRPPAARHRPRPRSGTTSRGPARSRRAAGTRADRPSDAGCTPGAGSWDS